MRIAKRPSAVSDLYDLAVYIGRDSADAAERFVDAAEATIARIAQFPESGTTFVTSNPRLKGMRVVRIEAFPNFLVFFLPRKETVEIVRVVHGARDFPKLFGTEP